MTDRLYDSDANEDRMVRFATIHPASGGGGLWDMTPWEGDEFCPTADGLDDYAADAGYTLAESPGELYAGLISGESDADGWIIPTPDSPYPDARPIAYRVEDPAA